MSTLKLRHFKKHIFLQGYSIKGTEQTNKQTAIFRDKFMLLQTKKAIFSTFFLKKILMAIKFLGYCLNIRRYIIFSHLASVSNSKIRKSMGAQGVTLALVTSQHWWWLTNHGTMGTHLLFVLTLSALIENSYNTRNADNLQNWTTICSLYLLK